MIKITYPILIEIAGYMGVKPSDSYDTLINTLKENHITVTTQAIPPGYILTFPSANHEALFKFKYSEILGKIILYDDWASKVL